MQTEPAHVNKLFEMILIYYQPQETDNGGRPRWAQGSS